MFLKNDKKLSRLWGPLHLLAKLDAPNREWVEGVPIPYSLGDRKIHPDENLLF